MDGNEKINKHEKNSNFLTHEYCLKLSEENPKLLDDFFDGFTFDKKNIKEEQIDIHEPAAVDKTIYGVLSREPTWFSYRYLYSIGRKIEDSTPVLYAEKKLAGFEIYTMNSKRKVVGTISFVSDEGFLLTENGREKFIIYFFYEHDKDEQDTGPRKILVVYDGLNNKSTIPLSIRLKKKQYSAMIFLINKAPYYIETLGGYAMDFEGRLKKASEHNFLLIHARDLIESCLVFGLKDKNDYVCDYLFPLNAIEAFYIGLCSLEAENMSKNKNNKQV